MKAILPENAAKAVSLYLAQFLNTPLPLTPLGHRSSYLCQTLYLSPRLGCCRQQTIRLLSAMHDVLRIDCASHKSVISASITSSKRRMSTSAMSQQNEATLGKYVLNFPFNMTSNLVSVQFLSGSQRESIARLSTPTCSFGLLYEDVCKADCLKWHKL